MFERETRREKILEARNKEIRLKEKTKGILGLGGGISGCMVSMGTAEGSCSNKFGSVAMTTLSDKNNPENKEGDTSLGEGLVPEKDAGGEDVDPILKAEREFFKIIKEVRRARFGDAHRLFLREARENVVVRKV